MSELIAALRRSNRYLRMASRDPGYYRALHLMVGFRGCCGHSSLSESEILEDPKLRPLYLQWILGACRAAMAACDQPPHLAARLFAGAECAYRAGLPPAEARALAREALENEHTPGLEAAFALGHRMMLEGVILPDSPQLDFESLGLVFRAMEASARLV